MDGGKIARLGFRFQDTAAIWLALKQYLENYFLQSGTFDVETLGIGIESTGSKDAPSWDVFLSIDGNIRKVYEAKSGAISKEDKTRVFWKRVRKEAASNPSGLKIGWILEKNNCGAFAEKLKGLKENANKISSADIPSTESDEDIRSWESLRSAALYKLCVENVAGVNPISLQIAKSLLTEMDIIEISIDELRRETDTLLDAFFPYAFPEHTIAQIREILEGKAVNKDATVVPVHDLFSATSFIFGDSNTREAYRFVKTNWSETAVIRDIGTNPETRCVCFAGLDHPVLKKASAQLDLCRGKHILISGHAGVGKSILTEILFKLKNRGLATPSVQGIPQSLYIHCSHIAAGIISIDTIKTALHVMNSLSPTIIAVDGLDDLHGSQLAELSSTLATVADMENLDILVSCRDEIIDNSPETEPIRKHKRFRAIRLDAWDVVEVKKIVSKILKIDYADRISTELILVLTTPFFLDIFLQICLEATSLNPDSDVFRIKNSVELLEMYMKTRISASRIGDKPAENQYRIEACNMLVEKVCENQIAFDRTVHPEGIASLLTNGVLIPSTLRKVMFRHRLLQDYLAADFVLEKIDAITDWDYSVISTIITDIRNASIRNGIIRMLAAMIFNSQSDDIFKKRLEWVNWLENKSFSENGDIVFSSFLTAWSRVSPNDFQKCDPLKWPEPTIPISARTVSMLVGEIRALPPVSLWEQALVWWDTAISNWTDKCYTDHPEVVLSICPLVEVLFQSRQWQPEEKSHEAASILMRWTHGKGQDLKQFGNHHPFFIETVCSLAAEIPFDWLVGQTDPLNSWTCGYAGKHLHKLIPHERLGDAIIHLCGIERETDTDDGVLRWKFKSGRGVSDMFDYRFLTENLKKRNIITTNPEIVFGAFAAYIDAVKNREDSHFFSSRGTDSGLCEDHSTTWYWRNSDREHNTAAQMVDAILVVLGQAALQESPDRFTTLKGILYSASDMILFRTLIADALIKADSYKHGWHADEWVELLTDPRLLDSYSMGFWIRTGISRWIGSFNPEVRNRIYEGIRQLVGKGKGYAAYECIRCAGDFVKKEAYDLAQIPVPEGYIEHEFVHPDDQPNNFIVTEMDDDMEEEIFFKDYSDPADKKDYHSLMKSNRAIFDIFDKSGEKSQEEYEKDIIPSIKAILERTVDCMVRILGTPDRRINDPYPLDYAYYFMDAIRRISFYHGKDKKASLSEKEMEIYRNTYSENVRQYAPWLEEAMNLALLTLKKHIFEENKPDESGADLYMHASSDWMYAIKLWNLLTWPTTSLASKEWGEKMQEALMDRDIPDSYRVVFITIFEPYLVHRSEKLSKMIWRWFEEADRAELIESYCRTLMYVFRSKQAEIIRIILEKDFLKGKRHDLDIWLCSSLSKCWYRLDIQKKDPVFGEVSAMGEQVLSGELPCPVPSDFATGFAFQLIEAYHTGMKEKEPFIDTARLSEGLRRAIDLYILSQKDTHQKQDTDFLGMTIGRCFDIPEGVTVATPGNLSSQVWPVTKPVILKFIEICDVQGIHSILYNLRKEDAVGDKERLPGIPPNWDSVMDIAEASLSRIMLLKETAMEDFASSGYEIVEFLLEMIKDNRLGRPASGSNQENRLMSIIPKLEFMSAPKIQELKQRVHD